MLFGKESIGSILENRGIDAVFLVCGENSYRLSGFGSFFEQLKIKTVLFSGFSPNPKYQEVCNGVRAFLDSGCNTILAVGGGSAIDTAKCIKLYASMDQDRPYYEQTPSNNDILLIAVPTTAGSGSESTKHIVIYRNGVKQSISEDGALPDYAVLEPGFLESLPLYQKKSTMLDALCHGIESFWAKGADLESRVYAMSAVRMINMIWRSYIFEGKYLAEMMCASNLAGQAISISKTTAAHAMSYGLTTMYGIAHGHAAALCLEQVWGGQDLNGINGVMAPSEFSEMLRELELAIPDSKDRDNDIKLLSEKVNPERLSNHPVSLSTDEIVTMYERIIKK